MNRCSKIRYLAAAGIAVTIAGCGASTKRGQLPTTPTTAGYAEDAPPGSSATTTPATPGASTPATSAAYYANCTAVRAAGAAPLYAGSPGYRSELDRNNNGVACE